MDADYTKRELDQHFQDLGDKVDDNTKITKDLATKVGIQNGRVAKIEGTAKGIVVAGCVVAALLSTVIGLSLYAYHLSLENLRQSILLELKK